MRNIRMTADGPIGRITLARPEKKNALDRVTADELAEALFALSEAPVRVVAIDGDGPDFCAGADLSALEEMLDAPRQQHIDDAKALAHVFHTIRRMEKPVVALVKGRAYAGGAGLATACDIVLAHEEARFAYPEVTIGFVPAMVMTMLRRSVGEKIAFDLISTGRILSADEAKAIGLVSRVFAAREFDQLSLSVLNQLADAAPSAIAATKTLFYKLDTLGFLDGISAGIVANADARSTPAFREGVKRFTSRKKDKS
ncbi:MAG: enoyl-CoA hydratase [Gemmatimonadetes bacterium]|nr:MAG: enoyl-CoA hydratase [Gemmatimonadota bacterium]PYP53773.1 MAG: enoyl-CoA hydratase [Gemmatimonadota bacterium]